MTIEPIGRVDFLQLYGNSFKRVFANPIGLQPFNNLNWEIALLPYGLNLVESNYQALATAAIAVGDSEFVVTEVESIEKHGISFVLPWSRELLDHVRCDSETGHLTTALFAGSTMWGAVSYPDIDCLILGGEQSYMRQFYIEAGGRENVRSCFITFATNEWKISADDKRTLLSLAGW